MKKKPYRYIFLLGIMTLMITSAFVIDNNNTMKEIKVEFPFKKFSSAQIYGDYIYASVEYDKKSYYDKLIKYDMKTKKHEVIFQSEFENPVIQNIMVNDKWVVWLDSDMSWGSIRIYCMDKKTNEKRLVRKLDSDVGNMDTPILYKNYISWIGFDNEDVPHVYIYDIENDEIIELYTLQNISFYNCGVHMNNDKLVWIDNINEKGYYFVYDLNNKKIKKYDSEHLYPGIARVSNDKIFSINFKYPDNWSYQEFGYYDIGNNENVIMERQDGIKMLDAKDGILGILNEKDKLEIYDTKKSVTEPVAIIEISKDDNSKYIKYFNFTAEGDLLFRVDVNHEDELYLVKLK